MQRRRFLKLSAGLAAAQMLPARPPAAEAALTGNGAQPAAFPVGIRVDAAHLEGEWKPIWRFFGYDEANYTYMRDGRALLSELGRLGAPQVHVRTHHLLTSGDGKPGLKWSSTNAYTEDAQGRPIYDWALTDRIFDTYLERGLKPYVQMGFMPEALSSHPQDYPHDPPPGTLTFPGSGFSAPPKDYAKWGELCREWAAHCGEKYGQGEASSWYWEVWNEPNIDYWRGTPEDYYKLYDYAAHGVRRALPTARVGGPETAGGPGGDFLRGFLEHCARGRNHATGQTGAPLDFVSFHAKGSPEFIDGHVRMGISHQLRDMDGAFAVVAAFPEFKRLPIVIGESDPEGCAACQGPQNGYRNGTMYSSYTAAVFARKPALAERHGVNLEGALTWAFEFEDQPLFAGFRVLASNGIDHPVLNVFRMFAKMGGARVESISSHAAPLDAMLTTGVRGQPDVSAVASLGAKTLCVMAWHYHDDDLPGPDAAVMLALRGLPPAYKSATLRHFRIDAQHSNAYEAWKGLGSPPHPTPAQYAALKASGGLALLAAPSTVRLENGAAAVPFTLPRQAVSLLELEWTG